MTYLYWLALVPLSWFVSVLFKVHNQNVRLALTASILLFVWGLANILSR